MLMYGRVVGGVYKIHGLSMYKVFYVNSYFICSYTFWDVRVVIGHSALYVYIKVRVLVC